MRAHLPSYPSNTLNSCCSSPALLCGLPWRLKGRRRGSHLGLSPGAQLRCEEVPANPSREPGFGAAQPGVRDEGLFPSIAMFRAAPGCRLSRTGFLQRVSDVPTSKSQRDPGQSTGTPLVEGTRWVSPPPLPWAASPSAGLLPNLRFLGSSKSPVVPNLSRPGAFRTPQTRPSPPAASAALGGWRHPAPQLALG